MNSKQFIIVDLDGTLSNNDHRTHLAQNQQWDDFHEAGKYDKPHEDVAWFIDNCSRFGNSIILILTGRNEKYRNATNDWLSRHKLMSVVDGIIMRPNNDFTPDIELKPRLLFDYMISKENALEKVIMILEDRDKMVEVWRNLGFACWQTRVGGY